MLSSEPLAANLSRNNPLRFETTKCSKQRIEQASIRTLFPKCVHKLGSPRFVLEAVLWSTAIADHVSSPAQGAALSSKCLFSVFQFMKCSWLRGKNASGNNKVLMMNVKCIHVHGARIMYVRWGWVGKKNFWALCSTKMATCKPCM